MLLINFHTCNFREPRSFMKNAKVNTRAGFTVDVFLSIILSDILCIRCVYVLYVHIVYYFYVLVHKYVCCQCVVYCLCIHMF